MLVTVRFESGSAAAAELSRKGADSLKEKKKKKKEEKRNHA